MTLWGYVDEDGRLVIPDPLAKMYGVRPGARFVVSEDQNALRLNRSPLQLNRIYLEVTNQCNLSCAMCIRRTWHEPMGFMGEEVFQRLESDLWDLEPKPSVCLSGLGEPLFHPKIVEWVWRLKQTGASVEIITNGTLLSRERSKGLIEAGLDVLWLSLDAADPIQYQAIRQGAVLEHVIENLQTFRALRPPSHKPTPQIGIVFVAMQSNLHELPQVIELGQKLGAVHFIVSNVYPYTEEMDRERLYVYSPKSITYFKSPWLPTLRFPKMDLEASEAVQKALHLAWSGLWNLEFGGINLSQTCDHCPFVERGSVVIGWDGRISPCIVLLRSHTTYLHGKPRQVRAYSVGTLGKQSLQEIWMAPDYVAFRERVQAFSFSPCTFCGGCDLSESNEEDCLRNPFPTCGGCFWAQGIIQCP
ncbi:radical SAM protein [uncultured Thermanaerothrix sp.]|uniref:radical SAM protein n=1 Tax=uncultured Thermanaerothrix sp. TaxID=1195149 RepID=UPI0026349845|nr:radical SAM protein [uncultured Thermanaerothrix sp.]